jgi:hypothetical protein
MKYEEKRILYFNPILLRMGILFPVPRSPFPLNCLIGLSFRNMPLIECSFHRSLFSLLINLETNREEVEKHKKRFLVLHHHGMVKVDTEKERVGDAEKILSFF